MNQIFNSTQPIKLLQSLYVIKWDGNLLNICSEYRVASPPIFDIFPDEVIYGDPIVRDGQQQCRSVLIRKGNDYTVWQVYGHTFTSDIPVKEYIHNANMSEPAVVLTNSDVIFPISRIIAEPSHHLRSWLASKKYDYIEKHAIIIIPRGPRKNAVIDNICAYKERGSYRDMYRNPEYPRDRRPTVELITGEEFELTAEGHTAIIENYMDRMGWTLLPPATLLGGT